MIVMPSLERIQEQLQSFTPNAAFELAENVSLLLYKGPNILVGICVADNAAWSQYETSYEAFKKLCRSKEHQNLEPSFVLCVDAAMHGIEKLSSSVETDVYFCRKYVLGYAGDVAEMLASLPFLPLGAIDTVGERPETAQTYLRQLGVSPELAQHIATPARRSAQAIVDMCLAGHYGNLQDSDHDTGKDRHRNGQRDGTSPVVVKSIEIKGFRAYKKSARFELGSKVTFLYGPNGFGKTSFFDAFDFVLTGGIGRLDTDSRGADLASLATNLDSERDAAHVTMALTYANSDAVIERSVTDSKFARIDGTKSDRKALLSKLTGASTPSADRVENLVSLFRATHLFSQEQQELTKDMQAKSELSSEIVSRMLALDDYTTSSSKLALVISEIDARVRALDLTISEASTRVAEAERSIADLRSKAGDVSTVDMDALVSPLIDEASSLGSIVSQQDSPSSTLRALRASLEYLLTEEEGIKQSLSSLRERAYSRSALISQVTSLEAAILDQQSVMERSDRDLRLNTDSLNSLAALIATGEAAESMLAGRRRNADWVAANAASYQALLEEVKRLEGLRPELQSEMQERAQVVQVAATQLASLDAILKVRQNDYSSAEAKVSEAAKIADQVSAFSSIRDAIVERQSHLKAILTDQLDVQLRIEEAEFASASSSSAVSSLQGEIAKQERSSDEVRSLIEKLRHHVDGPECPFCGHDHGSEDALLKTLARLDASDPVASLRSALRDTTERAQRDAAKVLELRSRAASLLATRDTLRSHIEEGERELSRLSALCISVGIDPSQSADPAVVVSGYVRDCTIQLDSAMTKLAEAREVAELRRREVASANEAAVLARSSNESNEDYIDEKRRELTGFEQNPSFSQDVMSKPQDELLTVLASIDSEVSSSTTGLANLRSRAADIRSAISGINAKAASARVEQARLRELLAGVRDLLTALDRDLSEQGVDLSDPATKIDALIGEAYGRSQAIGLLLGKVTSAELAVDAAMTAAALASLKEVVRSQGEIGSRALSDRNKYQPLHSFFRSLIERVRTQTRSAVTNFTTSYGPRTSVIQKRLRAVYGFEEVAITPIESRIAVSVSRQGKKLRPVDYFSQSQQQTLLLGLFLTACSSQTWSEFGPVLLDDPVAHFDDLNTYAFLDLIRGLLLEHGRQFVISTCDERFMQMAVRKFKSSGEEAKFYRFQSIGADGPEIIEV